MQGLYKNIILKTKDIKSLKSSSEFGEVFMNAILDYLSCEVYRIDDSVLLVNNISYIADNLNNLMDPSRTDEYFLDLLLEVVDAFNFNNQDHMMFLTMLDASEGGFDSSHFLISVRLSRNISSKDNFIWLCEQIENFYKKEKLYEKRG